ncbi:hypothetical protein BC940DRAFT_312627 [Gongronella butleri]|nr:hypothetical protein BC940DRAFT_312627 [Gongronella butleri]
MKLQFVSALIMMGSAMVLPQVFAVPRVSVDGVAHPAGSVYVRSASFASMPDRLEQHAAITTIAKRCNDDGGDDLDLNCLLETVTDLVGTIIGTGEEHDGLVEDLIHKVLVVVRELVHSLHLHGDDGGLLDLDHLLGGLLGSDEDDKDILLGLGLGGDHDDHGDIVAQLLKTVRHLLGQLLACDDDKGLITKLVKTVEHLLKGLLHDGGHDDLLRKRFVQLKRRANLVRRKPQLLHNVLKGAKGLDAASGLLENLEDLLKAVLDLLSDGDHLTGAVETALKEVTSLLDLVGLDKKNGGDTILPLVKSLVKDVLGIAGALPGGNDMKVNDLVTRLVDTVVDLVIGLRLMDLLALTKVLGGGDEVV